MVAVGLALPPVAPVRHGHQRARAVDPAPVPGGQPAISIISRCRSPASPCTEVIACSGIPGSSRISASLSPLGASRPSLPLTYSTTVASVSTDRPARGGLLT
jgi:hypothetical protein